MILPEIVAIGIFNSEIAAKNVCLSKKRITSMFEIELPICKGGISHIDTVARQITPDMVICAKPGQVRYTKFPFKCFYVHMIIHDGDLLNKLMKTPDYLDTTKASVYKEIFKKLIYHYNSLSDSEETILQSLILELIYTITKDASPHNIKSSLTNNHLMIERSLNYIKEHLTEELNLEKVAKSQSLSPVYFHSTFKRAIGKTLRDYIEEQRIKKAINLLLTTNLSLTQIAFDCGFSSQSYFSYVFKRRMNVTPREYVKKLYNMYEI